MGIKKTEKLSGLLRAAAERNWFRGYLLYVQNRPVAFAIGYIYRGYYLFESTGYDANWEKWSVGNILYLNIIRDLISLGGDVEWFDFMYGDTQYKERFSTNAHLEGNYYFIPSDLRWVAIVTTLKLFNRITDGLSRILEVFDLKNKIRRMLRRRSVQSVK